MNRWFGEPWPRADYRAPICENDSERVPTPIGRACLLCKESIEADHRGVLRTAIHGTPEEPTVTVEPVHIECSMRSVLGNHLHVAGECRFVGDCNERSTLTYRQEALEVWRMRSGA